MPEQVRSKYETITELSESHTLALTHDAASWANFLDSSAKLYKYPFTDQVLIHAQRPDATACASMQLWNEILHRGVKKGSKGIALIDDAEEGNQKPRLKYVFDIADTYGRGGAKPPYIWQMKPEHEGFVAETLGAAYETDNKKPSEQEDLKEQILELSKNLAEERAASASDANVSEDDKSVIKEILASSVGYVVLSRCGMDAGELASNFQTISQVSDLTDIAELGETTCELARDVLSHVENTVKRCERQKITEHRAQQTQQTIQVAQERGAEQDDRSNGNTVPAGRRLSAAGAENHGHDRAPDREIRADAESVPSKSQEGSVLGAAAPGETDGTPGGHGTGSVGTDREHGRRYGETGSAARQSGRPDGLGTAHELPAHDSGGNRDPRADLLLTDLLANPADGEERQDTPDALAPAPAQNPAESGAEPPYVAGDTVYLDKGREYQIERISERGIDLRVLNTDSDLLVTFRSVNREDFEKEFYENIFNQGLISERQKQARELRTQDIFPLLPHAPEAAELPAPVLTAENYRITDDNLGTGGQKTKYRNNVAAIRALREIEGEGRAAAPEEQEILSKYTGWGGIPQAFDSEHKDWKEEYKELKELLTDDEYTSARASTLNAHYTSPAVVKAIYETVERMGFTKGNVLEPSMGVGNFFGLLPESMEKSKLYGVELDSVTGRIAKQLYPQAEVSVTGFEKTSWPDNFFDLAVGNVPFGSYKVPDKKYDRHNFLIHDYFFAKTLDQVRPGGIVAFVTSKGTMDKANPAVRKYLSERAELLGAVRLPNNAFKANAGTEVTTDILFLQKRERPVTVDADWIHLGKTEDGIPINKFFAANPHMMLGKMVRDDAMYGGKNETACVPFTEGADGKNLFNLSSQLAEALRHIKGQITERNTEDISQSQKSQSGEKERESIPADPSVRNFSYTLLQDENGESQLYYRQNSLMHKSDLPAGTVERTKALVTLRDCVKKLIDVQLNSDDGAVQQEQQNLNDLYDRFTKNYGLVNSRDNAKAFTGDSSYYLLCSLEILDENGGLERKADMFSKRTIRQHTVPESADTASEALALSIAEKAEVDLDYMAGLLSGASPESVASALRGVIFPNPERRDENGNPCYETADEYLSGNVRHKLAAARYYAEADPALYTENVAALETAQPKNLEAHEIDVRLGAPWIEPRYIEQFMYELLGTPPQNRDEIKVHYSQHTAEWGIDNKKRDGLNIKANSVYGTEYANAYSIIEDSLNRRDTRITEKNADGKSVLNREETALAQQKQESIKQAFRDWVFKDPDRRGELVGVYNERFNSTRPREYDGSHIAFSGMNPDISLREHQINAIARILYGGNTLLAHEVGAGKTYEMIASAMEAKRLGIAQKSLFVVPNHLTK